MWISVILGVVAGLFSTNTASAQDLAWQLQSGASSPAARTNSGAAFDSRRGVTVLFGGGGLGNGYRDETWEFDGTSWTHRQVSGPSARSGAAMVYDAARGVTVLFGGFDANIYYNDTWEWNGSSWTQRMISGPSARSSPAMAYDSVRRTTVLFGGVDAGFGSYNPETWEWTGTDWLLRSVTGPSGRGSHTMSFDSTRGVTVLFGGRSSGTLYGDTWEWDGYVWTQRATTGPTPRIDSRMVYDAVRQVSVLVGGSLVVPIETTGTYFGDTWEWDGAAWTQRSTSGPSPRRFHAMVYDSTRGLTVLFGGNVGPVTSTYSSETWEWNGTDWARWLSERPSPRAEHAIAYDSARNVSVVFGGVTSFRVVTDETWEHNGADWTARRVPGPPARSLHAMAYDSARGVTVLFGGLVPVIGNMGAPLSDTWEWNGTAWTQRIVSGPSPRLAPAMAYDPGRGVTVLFGGSSISTAAGDTWEWNGSTWTQRGVTGPAARKGHAMVYDSARGVVVLFGGRSAGNTEVPNETWDWNGEVWTRRAVSGPPARSYLGMAYDAALGATVLFGGQRTFTYMNDTWVWDGTTWTQRLITGPSPRGSPVMAYDPTRHAVLLMGGAGQFFNGDTWWLCTPPTISIQPQPAAACSGESAAFSVSAAGYGPLTYEWQIQSSPATWLTLTETPVALTCGGFASAIAFDSPSPLISVLPCVSTGVYQIRVVVRDGDCTVASDAVSFTICAADFNCSGSVDSQDFFGFIAAFFSADASADFNHDLEITSQDFFNFLAVFFVGCD